MSKYFILGQIAALNYFKATIKPRRHDLRNTYWKIIIYLTSELDILNKMLRDGEMRFRVWNGGNR